MIKKSKKMFIFSFVGIGCFLLGTTSILSSCSTTTSNITPPTGQTTPDKPSSPTVSPEKPTQPTPIPPKPDKPLESVINQNSLSIKGIESKILPSMLLDGKKQNIDISKFEKNYNTNSITSETFSLIELDDLNGTISFEMSYQSVGTNSNKKFIFKFRNLMKISKDSSFYLSFKQDGNSFLSAYEYAKLLNDNKNNIEKFLEFIKLLEKENKNKFTIINGSGDIPLDYLKFNSYSLSGWNESWYTSSFQLPIKYSLKDVKIKYFQKNVDGSSINESTINFPSNALKEFTVNFCSASDYVTHNITVNSEFNEQKTSDYYWGDNRFNNSTEIGLKLSTSGWLKNYNESLDGNATKYKVILSDSSEHVSVLANKDLSINVKVKVEDNSSSIVYSSISKTLIISNIKKIVEDPFAYDSTATENKFSFNQKAEKLDSNLKILESDKESIKNFISDKNGQIDITSLLIKSKDKLKFSLLSGMDFSFNGTPLTKNNSTKAEYYSNDDIFVQNIGYNNENFQYFYNKDQDVFQVKIIPTIQLSTLYTSNNPITVNITKPNASLSKWK